MSFSFMSYISKSMIHLQKQPPEVFYKGVLENFAKLTGKHLPQSLFFSKVAGPRPETLWKKRLWHSCFPVNFAKILRTAFLQNTSRRQLLSTLGIKLLTCLHLDQSFLNERNFRHNVANCTVQKMKFFIKDFFSKCDQFRSFLWIWSHLLKKFLMEKFIFSAVLYKPIMFQQY